MGQANGIGRSYKALYAHARASGTPNETNIMSIFLVNTSPVVSSNTSNKTRFKSLQCKVTVCDGKKDLSYE